MSAIPRNEEMSGGERTTEPIPAEEKSSSEAKKKKIRRKKKRESNPEEPATSDATNTEPVGTDQKKTKKKKTKKKKKQENTAGVLERNRVGLVDTVEGEHNDGDNPALKHHHGVYRWGDHHHNDDHDTEDEDEFDDYDEKKWYFIFQFGAAWLYMTLVAISSAAPAWAQSSNGISDHAILVYNGTSQLHDVLDLSINTELGELKTQDMYNLWAHCHCYDTTRELCSTIRNFFIGGRIVSMLAVGGEFFIIFIHCMLYAGFFRTYRRGLSWTAWTLCVLVTLCLLVSFSTFSAAYARTWCGEKVSERGFISWIYGLRITEFVAMVFISSGSWIQAKRQSKRFVKTIIWCVLLCFISGIVSTTARAWVQTFDGEREIGLWQACQCWSDDCNSETSYFESMEAFAILSLISMGLFVVSYFLHISKKTQMPCLCFALFFNGIQLFVFLGWFYVGHCDDSSAFERRYTIQWPLIVLVVAMFLNCGMIANLTYRWCHSVV